NIPGEDAPALTCQRLPVRSEAVTYHDGHYSFLDSHRNLRLLNKGATLFAFCCKPGEALNKAELEIVDSVINITGFENEVEDNNVPVVDIYDGTEAQLYTVIITKVHYLLKDITLAEITPQFLASFEYHKACQPGGPKIWDEVPDDTTFRITKTLIPMVYDMTIQFKVHEVNDSDDLEKLSSLEPSMLIDRVIILERSKRSKNKTDATRKAKSILIYQEVSGGVHCMNITVGLNTSLPSFITPFIDGFGSFGSAEASQTAALTRTYLRKRAIAAGRKASMASMNDELQGVRLDSKSSENTGTEEHDTHGAAKVTVEVTGADGNTNNNSDEQNGKGNVQRSRSPELSEGYNTADNATSSSSDDFDSASEGDRSPEPNTPSEAQ
ncbi:hypothetical protein SARC_00790, partial [Sphaeroforma arctica JP610]